MLTHNTLVPHTWALKFAARYSGTIWERNMRTLFLCLILALVALSPAMTASISATVQSGRKTEVAEHVGFDKSCVAQRVVVTITAPPANGTATTIQEDKILPAKTKLGGAQSCAGKSAP